MLRNQEMSKNTLNRIVEEVTARTLVGSISLTIEKVAEEIAKEVLSDEEFRESLRTLVRAKVQGNHRRVAKINA
jgi:hypothetical protein